MKRNEKFGLSWFVGRRAPWTAWLVVSVTLHGLGTSGVLTAQEVGAFTDELLISETGLVVDLVEVLREKELERLSPNDLLVFEDGEIRTVTRLEPIAGEWSSKAVAVGADEEACLWSFVVYVDEVLGSPATVFDAAVALGQRTGVLSDLGCVDVAVADPVPRIVLAGSRAPRHIEKVLVDIATAAREERDKDPLQAELSAPARDWRDRSTIRTQWDRLINFVTARRLAGPRALFLISDGFLLSAADIEVLSGRGPIHTALALDRGLADVVMDTAQALSSYGWLTIPLPITGERKEQREPEADEFESWRDVAEGREEWAGERRTVLNFFGTALPGRAAAALDDRLYEAYLLPELAPLRALAEATAGGIAWHQGQLDQLLRRLRDKWRVWFQSSEPHDGHIRRLEVRLAERDIYPRAPWWKRSSTPHLVAESRLRRLLDKERIPARLQVQSEVLRPEYAPQGSPGQSAIRIQVAPVAFENGVSIGHVRVCLGFEDSSGVSSFLHQIDYEAPPLGGEWEYTLSFVLPAGTRRIALGVEDLSLEVWGATIIEISQEEGDS